MKTILLAEDDPFLVDIYITKLKEAGFEVEAVNDGEDVVKRLKQKNLQGKPLWPDLLILDIVLPRTDGWEILKKIKEDSFLKELKIIILSNLGQKAEVERGFELGATRYLIKAHYTPSEVVEEIKKIIG
jgi:DNA-binding response OmpR family regulator